MSPANSSAHLPGPRPSVAVIGGGLAGIAAAIALAEAGAAVTLLEARPRLGGATCSFARDGLVVDTGQHIYLGCCTAYRGLLDKLGMTAHAPIQGRFDVTVLAPGSRSAGSGGTSPKSPLTPRMAGSGGRSSKAPRRGRLRRTALPGPLHMLPALGRYPFLSLAERARVSRPALAMRRVDPAAPAVDEQRFGDWLAARGQSDRARRALWDLFTVSALNIAGDDASLSLAATVVKTGLLGKNNAADIGVPARPLGELHGDAAATLLTKLGAQVYMGAKVAAIEPATSPTHPVNPISPTDPISPVSPTDPISPVSPTDPVSPVDSASPINVPSPDNPSRPRFRIRLAHPVDPVDPVDPADPADLADPAAASPAAADATEIAADAVVLAVPHEAAARLIPPGALPDATVSGWAGLGASPIVNVHVIYDRPVTDLPFAAAVDSPVQWVFDRTRISGLDRLSPGRPQYLAISLSAADEYVDVPAAALQEQFVPALAELFPAAREAQVTEFFVTRERRATFRQAPGTARLRPGPGTQLPGLVLAGAWTDTGWPDTMESAVRSGLAAASELRRTVLSAAGLSRAGYSGSGISEPGTNASASTIGVRQ
jgi:uncharacterized protein with NAD-binding domain and iron-sulfur cluster